MKRPASRTTVSLLLWVPFVFAGCGTSDYNERLESGIRKIKNEQKYSGLYGYQALPDTPIALRMPKLFSNPAMVEGIAINDKPVDVRRIKPGIFEFPGLKYTYEVMMDGPDGLKLPCTCYVGGVSSAGQDPGGSIVNDLKAKGPFEPAPAWTEFRSDPPEGEPAVWQKLHVVGPMEFYAVDGAGAEQYVQQPGVLDVYLHDDAGYYVIIAWRYPVALEKNVNVDGWMPMVAGCAKVNQQ